MIQQRRRIQYQRRGRIRKYLLDCHRLSRFRNLASQVSNMNVKRENICRLCLKVAENDFEILDATINGMFQFLLLRPNLEISEDPIVCRECKGVAIKCFDFKSICMATEERVISFADNKSRATFNLKDIFNDGHDIETVDDNFICRFCLNHLSDGNFVFLDNLMNDVTFAEKLQALMPVMNFDVIKNPVICTSCSQGLECYVKFVDNCLDVEAKVDKYCRNYDPGSYAQIKLGDVLQLEWNNNSQVSEIKKEDTFEDIGEALSDVYSGELIKQEEEIDVTEHRVNFNETVWQSPSNTPMHLNISSELKSETLETDKVVGKAIFKCEFCTFETKRKSSLDNHTLTHKTIIDLETYKRSKRTFQAKRKRALKNRTLIHKDIKKVGIYKCPMCTYETKRKQSLTTHTFFHRKLAEVKIYGCSMCAFQAKQKSYLNKHMLTHRDVTETAMYKCSICAFQTKRKGNLKDHMLVHKDISEVEVYKCSTCDFQAKRKGILKRHILIHRDVSEVEMYKCAKCDYQTRRKYYLKHHVRSHDK